MTFLCGLFFLVPQYSPSNVTGSNISSTALKVTWSGFPANGPIEEYMVTVVSLDEPNISRKGWMTEDVNQTIFSDLNVYTNYTVCVFPVNWVGVGISPGCVDVLTDEDGK